MFMVIICNVGLLYQVHMEQEYHIYDTTLRFHVRAVSDESEEQNIKLKVRDGVLRFLKEEADGASSAQELQEWLETRKGAVRAAALETLEKLGYQREVKISVAKERFPIRHYGTVIFPAGEYQALRVDIGEAKGHNWWCAIYPELCYNTEEEFGLSGKGKEDLERDLSKKEQETLASSEIKLRFKLLEWIADCFED